MTEKIKDKAPKNWLVGEAVDECEKIAGYDKKESLLHGLGHIMGTTLVKHNMSFEDVRKEMPSNRIAGYEAECATTIYEVNLARYPKKLQNVLGINSNDENIIAETIRKGAINYAYKQAQEDLKNITSTNGDKHLEHRLLYAKNFDQIKWPSIDEIKFHMKAAEKFCEEFAAKHGGKYPSEFSDEELAKMPLSNFSIDHEFPDDIKKKWKNQEKAWKKAIEKSKNNTTEAEIWIAELAALEERKLSAECSFSASKFHKIEDIEINKATRNAPFTESHVNKLLQEKETSKNMQL
jgi:hypothetical protein